MRSNPVITLDDLVSWKTLETLSDDLVLSLSKIEIKPLPDDLESMSPMNLRRWCYIQDPYFRSLMSKFHPKAFKIDRKSINEMIQEYRENGQFMLIEKVKEQLEFCISN